MHATTIETTLEIVATAAILFVMTAIIWRASVAEWRASRLLKRLLTEAELRQLAADGYLEAPSHIAPGRAYHIPRGPGRVRMYESGQLICELCLLSTTPLPASDLILLHKLLIEEDEQRYLETANHFPPSVPGASQVA